VAKPAALMLFGTRHSKVPCPSCIKSRDFLRRESVLPLPASAGPLSIKKEIGPICVDCAAAESLRRFNPGLTWSMARIVIANDRAEKIRLPGAPIGLHYVRAAVPGDLDRLLAWQDRTLPEEP